MVGRRLRELRRDLREIRRTLTPTRDAVHKVLDGRIELDDDRDEGTEELFPRDVEIAFSDAYDKLLRATEALESSRDSLAGVRDYLQGTIANDQNEVVKRLTVIASLLLVPTFIVGLYGQNFRDMPELHWMLGLLVVVGLDHRHDDRAARVLPLEALDLGSPSDHAAWRASRAFASSTHTSEGMPHTDWRCATLPAPFERGDREENPPGARDAGRASERGISVHGMEPRRDERRRQQSGGGRWLSRSAWLDEAASRHMWAADAELEPLGVVARREARHRGHRR